MPPSVSFPDPSVEGKWAYGDNVTWIDLATQGWPTSRVTLRGRREYEGEHRFEPISLKIYTTKRPTIYLACVPGFLHLQSTVDTATPLVPIPHPNVKGRDLGLLEP